MVSYKSAAIGIVGALLAPLTGAFTSPTNPAAKKVELAREKVENEYLKMATGSDMKMVAGGAQAEEYYEGGIFYCGTSFNLLAITHNLDFSNIIFPTRCTHRSSS